MLRENLDYNQRHTVGCDVCKKLKPISRMFVTYNDQLENSLLLICSEKCLNRDRANGVPWMTCEECEGYFLDGDEFAMYGDLNTDTHLLCSKECDIEYHRRNCDPMIFDEWQQRVKST